MDVEMGWCDYNSLCRKKEKDIVYGCGRSLGSFPVCPLQRLCSAETAFVSLSSPALFSFFPFSSFRYLSSSSTRLLSFYLCIFFNWLDSEHVELGTNQNSSVDCHCSWWPCQEGLVFQTTRPIWYAHWQQDIPIELIYVYSSCCYCGWRTNTYDYCYEEDTEPLLERELWPVTWHTQPR